MKETKVGGVEIGDSLVNTDPYIIALFGEENAGKTRFCLTGPDVVGCVPLEMKAYKTLDKTAAELGKRIIKPKNPMDIIVNIRQVNVIAETINQQKFYIEHLKKVQGYIFGLLEMPDVQTVMIDKFTTLCMWFEYAVNGMQDKIIKVDGKPYKARAELNQTITDFMNALSQYRKTVILTNASKDDYDFLNADKKPARKTWDGFKFLGSHANIVCEMVDNKWWNPTKIDDGRYNWHYGLNVRRCQDNMLLEGPDGQLLLRDEMVSLVQLISQVDPNCDLERYM